MLYLDQHSVLLLTKDKRSIDFLISHQASYQKIHIIYILKKSKATTLFFGYYRILSLKQNIFKVTKI
ncbi:hypothetical protein BpHYR1_034839 [Brachionus plicatilis]|uniref:Uncharacterized protein n=1 Tax=Brachionus plicatilis TaxID=10195 RepID=A0A3M7TAF6_BRAPC|nr:hypothetical protein BpHYR1_034839 [Brachionus plicatilis]